MDTLGRVFLTLILGCIGVALHQLGAEMIRGSAPPFNLLEFGGFIAVGAGWAAFWLGAHVWTGRSA